MDEAVAVRQDAIGQDLDRPIWTEPFAAGRIPAELTYAAITPVANRSARL
jgi:hypothetical protein